MVFAVALLMGKGEQDLSTENRKMKKWEQTGLLIFRGKKSGIFRGKFAETSVDFVGFSREESQNSPKNRPISWILAVKIQILKDFQGQILRKLDRFHRKLRQETISKKQPISLDFFWQISLKSINFALIWPALFNVFLTGIIIYSFNNSSLEKWVNAKAINIMVIAQFFATFT